MISVQMNDAAADSLGMPVTGSNADGFDGLIPELRELAQTGVVRCGEVVVFADQVDKASRPMGNFFDMTQWEVDVNSFHLDAVVPVDKSSLEELGTPVISEVDQRRMLVQGLMLALRIARSGQALDDPVALRCIVGTNSTCGTFRFHRVRAGEQWHNSDLDWGAPEEKVIVVETTAHKYLSGPTGFDS
ncbi:hypothetical protein [Nocardia brasiliensis]|uniref:hypothetical protein n=1 Tax=Nocardia brasiliensis TaxID=37326 RepID=UPI002453D886|nr:hypothetical protein [Nocardia brasiliensis]